MGRIWIHQKSGGGEKKSTFDETARIPEQVQIFYI